MNKFSFIVFFVISFCPAKLKSAVMKKSDPKTGYFLLVCITFSLITVLVTDVIAQSESAILLTDLQVEYFANPVGIDDSNPRLSWKIQSTERNIRQTAYQIQVSEVPNFSPTIWDTERQNSNYSIQQCLHPAPCLEMSLNLMERFCRPGLM